jgi:DNA-binding beta-propeller fold protein YncE
MVLALLVLAFIALGVTPASAALTVTDGMAASLVLGQPDFTSNTQATTQTGMNAPHGVAVDPTTGKVFVADTNDNRVLRYASIATLSSGAAAEAVLGQPNFTSNTAAATQNGMQSPFGVYVDSAGRLWVGDGGNSRVLRFDNASSITSGANADAVLGQPGFTSNTQATSQSGMRVPMGVFLDSAGRLWVADYDNSRVLRFDNAASKANGADADGVLGQSNFTSSTWATTQSNMNAPTGVTGDESTGQIFVSDRSNNRVLVFNNAASKANGANADNVIGQANFTSGGPSLTATGLNNPNQIHFDPTEGVLWVADTGYHRALLYGTLPPCGASVTNTNDSGAGSLRQAIADVCPNGTIDFASGLSGQTIGLDSTLTIDKDLTIDGSSLASQVSINGNNTVGLFTVNSGITAIFNNLKFINGRTDTPPVTGAAEPSGMLAL